MSTIRSFPLQSSAILRINSERNLIEVEPWYQRQGDIWDLDKKQLLIDSILNEFDIPKLYFHVLPRGSSSPSRDYAIIDGRQRLETIWSFMDDAFSLADDFEYFADSSIKAGRLTYSELATQYPKLKIRFDSFTLPIVCVETDDIDLIEDMFSRLNEAVPLKAAEKRNAIGGPMAACIRQVADHVFFAKCVRFSNKRYQHREAAAKMLFVEFSIKTNGRIIDTKKPYMDDMVERYKKGEFDDHDLLTRQSVAVLNRMSAAFAPADELLRSQAVVPIFYLVMRSALECNEESKFRRAGIVEFYSKLAENRSKAEKDMAGASFELLEYDRMSQQGTNDAASLKERTRILGAALGIKSEIK